MIKVVSTWNVPAESGPEEADDCFHGIHRENVRNLPRVRHHLLLKGIRDYRGGHPAWWRGEEIWFDDIEELREAMAAPEWEAMRSDGLEEMVVGPRLDLFEIEDEYSPPESAERIPPAGAVTTALTRIWQVPATMLPDDVNPVYREVHVPGARSLERLRRHTAMLRRAWPSPEDDRRLDTSSIHHPRYFRRSEVRFDTGEDLENALATELWSEIRDDAFQRVTPVPEIDIFAIEEEWIAPG